MNMRLKIRFICSMLDYLKKWNTLRCSNKLKLFSFSIVSFRLSRHLYSCLKSLSDLLEVVVIFNYCESPRNQRHSMGLFVKQSLNLYLPCLGWNPHYRDNEWQNLAIMLLIHQIRRKSEQLTRHLCWSHCWLKTDNLQYCWPFLDNTNRYLWRGRRERR